PDRERYAADRFAVEIENPSRHLDHLSQCLPFDPFDCGQVGLRDRRVSGWEIGTENLVRGPLPALPRVRCVCLYWADHDAPQSSGVKPEACTIGPQRSKSNLTSFANS